MSLYPEMKITERHVRLEEFKNRYEAAENFALHITRNSVKEYNTRIGTTIVFIFVALWAIIYLIKKKVIPQAKKVKGQIQVKTDEAKAKRDDARVRKIAEEEVIREAVRRTLKMKILKSKISYQRRCGRRRHPNS